MAGQRTDGRRAGTESGEPAEERIPSVAYRLAPAAPRERDRLRVEAEAERCAQDLFEELTGGRPKPGFWYRWYLCERHGGAPILDPTMPRRQIAYWDGEDIVLDAKASREELTAALPEELAHRLTSAVTPRCEPMNYDLRYAHTVGRIAFQEMVGQRVAELFERATHQEKR